MYLYTVYIICNIHYLLHNKRGNVTETRATTGKTAGPAEIIRSVNFDRKYFSPITK